MKKMHCYEDPGHSWMKISRKDLIRLGIEDKITGFSYMHKDQVYLEEDLDVKTFEEALHKIDYPHIDVTQFRPLFNSALVNHFTNNRSRIRNYAHFLCGAEYDEYRDKQAAIMNYRPWNKKGINTILKGSLDDMNYWLNYYNIPYNVS